MNNPDFGNIIVTSLFSSIFTTALITFILKKYFENKLKFHFDEKLEELKNKLYVVAEDVIKPRFEAYGKLASMVYSVRNKCREISVAKEGPKSSFAQELQKKIDNLANLLIKYRAFWENKIFEEAHRYKNKLILFNQIVGDFIFYVNHKDNEKIQSTKNELIKIYNEIDQDHKLIIKNLKITDITFDIKK